MAVHIIFYNSNGGSEVPYGSGEYLPTPLPTTTRAGYQFDGWYYDNTTFQREAHSGDPLYETVTLYAKWTQIAPVYTITYNTNGGSAVATGSGSALPSPLPTTTRTGFTFAGWFYDSTFQTQANAGDVLSANVTLYAKWATSSTDPYAPIGYITQAGGGGTFTPSTDTVPAPAAPSINASGIGMIKVYNPTDSELIDLAEYLYSKNFFDNFAKLFFGDIKDIIFNLGVIPGIIGANDVGSASNLTIGYLKTDVKMKPLLVQYKRVSLGSVNIAEFYGSFIDYAPHTTIQIYLPFIGLQTLDTNLIMGKTISLYYTFDLFTGALVATIEVGGSVLYTYSSSCMTTIPITSENWTNMIRSLISICGETATLADQIEKARASKHPQPLTGGTIAGYALSTEVNILEAFTPSVSRSGGLSSNVGMMAPQVPYLIITRKVPAISEYQALYEGYQSLITSTLSSLSGWTEVHEVHLENIPATSDEIAEIESLLKRGVII